MKTTLTILTFLLLGCLKGFGQQITNGLVSAYYFTGGSLQEASTTYVGITDAEVTVTPYGAPSSFTFSRTPQTTTDRFGNSNALDFNALSLQVDNGMGMPMDQTYATAIAISATGLATTTYSYSLWYKIAEGSASSPQYLLSIGNDGGDQTVNVMNTSIRAHSYYQDPYSIGGPLLFPISTLSTSYLTGWNHFVAVRSLDSLKIFINGSLADKLEIPVNNNGSSDPFYGFNQTNAIIGARYNKTGGYTGYLDDLRIFDYPLTNAEVLQEYNYSSVSEYTLSNTGNLDHSASGKTFFVYPNPASDKLEISIDEVHDYELLSPSGGTILIGKTNEPIDVRGMAKGIYFLKIDQSVEKVIIQ